MITVETLVARVVAETGEFKKGMAEVEAASNKTGKMAGIAGLAIAAGLAYGIDKSVEAAMHMEEETARLDTAFSSAGLNAHQFESQILGAESAGRKLGFTNADVRGSLGSLVTATRDGNKALMDLGVAEDIARFKHVDLTAASKMLTSSMAGNTRAAKALGIVVLPVTDNMDALRQKHEDTTTAAYKLELQHAKLADKMATADSVIQSVTAHVHGQADAFASTAGGAAATFHAEMNALGETLGKSLLPAVTAISKALAGAASFMTEHATLTKVLAAAFGVLAISLLGVAAATWAMNSALLANPITWVVVGIVALGVALAVAYEKVKIFRQIVDLSFAAVKTAFKIVIDLITFQWASAWSDFAPRVEHAIGAVVNAIVTIGPRVVAAAIELGKNLVQGIIGGLGDIGSAILHHLTGGLSSAIDGVKSFFGIASPSKTTRDEIGIPLMQGIAEGITQHAHTVWDAAQQAFVWVMNKPHVDFVKKYWHDQINEAINGLTPDNAKLTSIAQQFGLQVHNKFLDSFIKANEALALDMKSTNPKYLYDFVQYAVAQMNEALKKHQKGHADAWRNLANQALKAYTDEINKIKDAAAKAAADATAKVHVAVVSKPVASDNQSANFGFGGGGSNGSFLPFDPRTAFGQPSVGKPTTMVVVNNPTLLTGSRDDLRRFADTLQEFLP